ncbi:MAG TPA: UbiA family prenyltransferase [Saprospiraceae bacterium]|nr:UbiA family prenyltransferase [Saprospiraceae bacterium]
MQVIAEPVSTFSWKTELSLIRWPNLVIILCLQIIGYFVFVKPVSPGDTFEGYLFLTLLILMTMSAAIAGYYINDLWDRDADRLNGRKNVLNTGEHSPKFVRRNYILFIVFGACCTIFLINWSMHFLWIYAGVTLLLWAYSRYLKRLPLIGNLAVSSFCAGVIVILWFPVRPFSTMPEDLCWLIIFAFLITLIREIVKDMEDMYGDGQVGDRTLPLVLGIPGTKAVVAILLILSIVGLFHPDIRVSWTETVAFTFWVGTIAILLGGFIYFIVNAKDRAGFHITSLLLKSAMLSGTLCIVL